MTTAPINADTEARSPKGRRTRARLLAAARTVFERDGFLNARVADISETAGLSHGSFYHYFDSKEQIFRELAEAQEVSVLTMHKPGEHSPPDQPPIDRIREGNRHYLEAYKREAKLMRVIEEVSRRRRVGRHGREVRRDVVLSGRSLQHEQGGRAADTAVGERPRGRSGEAGHEALTRDAAPAARSRLRQAIRPANRGLVLCARR
jgi:AcrR family transcriptional regulator